MHSWLPGLVEVLRTDHHVEPFVGNRIHPNPAPHGTASPFLTYSVVSILPQAQTFTGTPYDRWTIEIDCWVLENPQTGSRYAQAQDLADAVINALDNTSGVLHGQHVDWVNLSNQVDLFEGEWRRKLLEFQCNVRREPPHGH